MCPECGGLGDAGICPRDQAVREPAGADPMLGTVIGSWQIARLLGVGGMGRVYRAVQPAIGGRVAIKVLKPDSAASPDLVERFFNEARAVNLIRHDNIVDIIDLGRLADGSPYIVMEYLEGATLGALLRRGDVALGTLARVVGDVLAALEAAHGKGIIHRDLKPDNIFISPTGRVTVLDFGIAKLVTAGPTTLSGSLLGTPGYMSPEQARSQPLDARTDLYAAGVILYEGATGSLPFAAANLYDLLDLQIKAPPEPPRTRKPELPAAVEQVIMTALAKDPADRFASAAAMRAALATSVEKLPPADFAAIAPLVTAQTGARGPNAATQSSLAQGETMPSGPNAEPATQSSLAQGETLPSTAPETRPRMSRAAVVACGVGAVAIFVGVATLTRGGPDSARSDAKIDAGAGSAAALAELAARVREANVTLPVDHPEAFDPVAFAALAQAQSDAILGKSLPIEMGYRDFDRSGHIDLAVGGASYIFAVVEVSANPRSACLLQFEVDKRGETIQSLKPCARGFAMTVNRCSLADFWRKAAALPHFPNDLQLATLNHEGRGDGWQFVALEATGERFSEQLTDDCP